MDDSIGVPEIYIGKNVFVTGGTGFMGKMLIEKLLRSCPGINKIYVLMRERRGKTIPERMEAVSKMPLFVKLHEERPGDFASKVIPISGNVCELNLGLSRSDRRLLIEDIDIIFHVAATVKFDQPLKDAILMNMRGTREVCTLALDSKNIQLMVHISTAYAHATHNPIEETMYPAAGDWRKMIKIAERLDSCEISKLQAQILGPFPNTYTFTKGLGEHVVYDMLNERVANMIFRPTIVLGALRDPVPGWIDNFNGPSGLVVALSTGLLRISLLQHTVCDHIPVDLATRVIIMATWYRLTNMAEEKTTSVHNCGGSLINNQISVSCYELATLLNSHKDEIVSSKCVWYPTMNHTQNPTVYYVYFMLLHVLPALFFDSILRMLKYPPAILMFHRRVFVAVNAVFYFLRNEWRIDCTSLQSFEFKLLEKDHDDFAFQGESIDRRDFVRICMLGGCKYLLKDDMNKMEEYRRKNRILKYADIIFNILWYAFFFNLLVIKWNVVGLTYNYFAAYLESL